METNQTTITKETSKKPLKPKPVSYKRKNFNKTYGQMNDKELLQENLFAQQLQIEKLELIRSNTSKLVWWIIAIPIIFVLILIVFGGIGSLAII